MPAVPPDVPVVLPARRVDASMSLLVDMMNDTLDGAYAERAQRPPGTPPPAPASVRERSRGVLPVIVLVSLGLLTGTAIAQVRERQDAGTGLRAELADEVRVRTARSDDLAARTEALREDVAAVREAALSSDSAGRELADRLGALGLASATTSVSGPGIVVTVQDAPAASGVGSLEPAAAEMDGRITDRDLQDIVNGLWVAGAEAVAVNGQRLTVLTAIRSAGEAILVDLRPLTPPYVVQAIGDPADLELAFLDGPSGQRLMTLTSLYGIEFEVSRAEKLTLAGAAVPDLRSAFPLPGSGS